MYAQLPRFNSPSSCLSTIFDKFHYCTDSLLLGYCICVCEHAFEEIWIARVGSEGWVAIVGSSGELLGELLVGGRPSFPILDAFEAQEKSCIVRSILKRLTRAWVCDIMIARCRLQPALPPSSELAPG